MIHFPDFTNYGYRVEEELSQNRAGGRVTYRATDISTDQQVVIKQFQFAKTGSSWAEYDTYAREIDTMRGLDHPSIPAYLNSFQTDDGFCMVQEYKKALSLSAPRSFSHQDVRKIAVSLLEILVYLQSRIPPVIHRDLKPENILVDEAMNVYLVDFGFARIGDGNVGISSVVKGTLGFMPPEQIFNRQLTEASDLYGLGVTLICLLTNTRSTEVGSLIDITYQVNFRHLVPKISQHWVNWLEKLVEPRLKDRFPNAAAALAAMPQDLMLPEAVFSQASLDLKAVRASEVLTRRITIHNSVPQTLLEGRWEVAPHPSDPPHTPNRHVWIAVVPSHFEANEAECEIRIDTSRLIPNKTYQRRLLLHSNAHAKTYTLDLKLQTALAPVNQRLPLSVVLALLFVAALTTAWFTVWGALVTQSYVGGAIAACFYTMIGAAIGFEVASWMLGNAAAKTGAVTAVVAGFLMGIGALGMLPNLPPLEFGVGTIASLVIGLLGGAAGGLLMGTIAERLVARNFHKHFSVGLSLFTTAFASSVALGLSPLSFFNPLVITAFVGSVLPLTGMLLQLPLRRAQPFSEYAQREQHLIKP
jgi:serine/threonine protein kinase